jgi:hypothetical protein
VATIIGLQVVLQGFAIGGQRKKLFSKQYFAKHFKELKTPPQGGYPDMGNGRFSQYWTLEQWIE